MTFSNCSAVCLYVAPSVEPLPFPQLEFLDQRDLSRAAAQVFATKESAARTPALTSYNYSYTVLLSQQWDLSPSPPPSLSLSICIILPNYCYSSCGNGSFHPPTVSVTAL